jgi:hypothetical protein
MTSSAFDLADFDDGPTVVTASPFFHTQVMDRRQLPPTSGVMPVSRPPYVAPSFAPPPVARPGSSPDFTQPALRVRRDLAGTRRLAVGLAIGFAFLFGLAGAFVFQTMSTSPAPSPAAARAPRSVTDRSSTLDTRSTPDALPKTDEAPLASAPRVRTTKRPAAAPATNEAGDTTPSTTSEGESLEGRDLLGEGLGGP